MLGTEVSGGVSGVSDLVVLIMGVASAVIDNVPLVAASLGMFSDPIDSPLWHFIAYSAGTGGSMLIIGSAAGVVAMGMEQINFFWYMKKISLLALVGFLAGAACFMLMRVVL
jgi:Na+/H+ antiporter NhaD/arsenite permease-like protein